MGRSLRRIALVAANTFRETVRERVLYNLVFFAIGMTLAGFVVGQLSIRQDQKILKDLGLAAMDLFGTVIAVFIGVGLIGKEIERRSLYPLLARPLTRGEFFVGKFAGLAFTLLVNLGVMALGLYLTLWASGYGLDPLLMRAIGPLYLGLLIVVAVALLFSSLLRSPALATVGTVGVVIAGRFSDVIRNMREVAPEVPPWLLDGLYYALPNLRSLDFKSLAAYGDPIPASVLAWAFAYAAAYISIVLYAGLRSFSSRDLE
jgi:hypothetical protein